jgi:hypothetical protein
VCRFALVAVGIVDKTPAHFFFFFFGWFAFANIKKNILVVARFFLMGGGGLVYIHAALSIPAGQFPPLEWQRCWFIGMSSATLFVNPKEGCALRV